MDSLTQLTLGAAVGEAVLGRQVGRRAALWGALLGTLPDLDVLVPLGDAVRDFTYHRGPSHSLFVLAALTPLVVWLILKIHPQTRPLRRRWAVLVYAVFATHVLLDALTVYGTQIFWPLPVPPASWATIFVIDPFYTVPLLLGVLAALILRRTNPRGRWLNGAGLALSTLYLVWSIGAKLHVNAVVEAELARATFPHDRFLTIPTPFNTLLWRVLVMTPTGYAEGYHSLLDRTRLLEFTHYPSQPELLAGLEDAWTVRRLQWFTHGFYAVGREGDAVVMTDLRMGLEPDYFFRFQVGAVHNPRVVPVESRRLPVERRLDRLGELWDRLRGAPVAAGPAKVSVEPLRGG